MMQVWAILDHSNVHKIIIYNFLLAKSKMQKYRSDSMESTQQEEEN